MSKSFRRVSRVNPLGVYRSIVEFFNHDSEQQITLNSCFKLDKKIFFLILRNATYVDMNKRQIIRMVEIVVKVVFDEIQTFIYV